MFQDALRDSVSVLVEFLVGQLYYPRLDRKFVRETRGHFAEPSRDGLLDLFPSQPLKSTTRVITLVDDPLLVFWKTQMFHV
jgi:hypothetical protein